MQNKFDDETVLGTDSTYYDSSDGVGAGHARQEKLFELNDLTEKNLSLYFAAKGLLLSDKKNKFFT